MHKHDICPPQRIKGLRVFTREETEARLLDSRDTMCKGTVRCDYPGKGKLTVNPTQVERAPMWFLIGQTLHDIKSPAQFMR